MEQERRQDDRGRERGGRGGRQVPGAAPETRAGMRSGGLEVPGTPREPIGRERAAGRPSGPPRRRSAAQEPEPPRPALPEDEEPDLPRGVRREIQRVIGHPARARDVMLALSIGGAAIDEERTDVALEALAWAKHQAPRIAAIREAYGIALYLAEDYHEALTELQAYRRFTGRVDQNHVVADCLRALDRDLDQIITAASELLASEDAPVDRRAEAAIVWAGALADAGDVGAGRAVLRRVLDDGLDVGQDAELRARSLAADLAVRAGDLREAISHLDVVAGTDGELYDAARRLQHVRGLAAS